MNGQVTLYFLESPTGAVTVHADPYPENVPDAEFTEVHVVAGLVLLAVRKLLDAKNPEQHLEMIRFLTDAEGGENHDTERTH